MVALAWRSCLARSRSLAAASSCAENTCSCSLVLASSCDRVSRSSVSRRSRRRCSRKISPSRARTSSSCSRRSSCLALFSACSDSLVWCISISWPSRSLACTPCSSACRVRSSRVFISSLTMVSCPAAILDPFSTSLVKLVISSLSWVIVSFALVSFSLATSTSFQAFSICFRSVAMVFWSSWESLRAVWTLATLFTISPFNSRTFLISFFSWSWLRFRARWSFSYSMRNFSRDLSPTSCARTSWKSRSSASKAAALASGSSPSFPLGASPADASSTLMGGKQRPP
mmetsp:Transcript_40025/g.89753  ORF Transcript_40025/g.89753 Transcript_40025/m.89753 type:complete len:286 (-) Transcript_40025:57-914(-)